MSFIVIYLKEGNMDLSNDLTKIILAVITAIIGTGLIFKFISKKKNKNKSGSVSIKNSKVGGDVAGRDINK
ncbi:MAG TPA: hypothetical protein VL443_03340 [Cyclobacteriaceae bacterium]|jgi:hypothetical protein|nr:hypothetical protein [Cyclobacteriaceae bacterium]